MLANSTRESPYCPDFSDRSGNLLASIVHIRRSPRSASTLTVTPPHSFVLALLLIVCFPALHSAVAKAQVDHESSTLATSKAVPQAHVSTATVRLPIVDGKDIRFARPYTGDGLSQTKVGERYVKPILFEPLPCSNLVA
jgi:hypothetical protein